MTDDEFRKLALEIPGAIEGAHMKHPDFRVNGKIFASLGVPDKNWAMVKLTPEQQRVVMAKTPKVFKPCSGAWGRQGATNVDLGAANWRVVRSALQAAVKNVTAKKKRTPNAQRRTSNLE